MCRYRVSFSQSKLLALRCRNLVWHEHALSESDTLQLLNALEDMIYDRESRRRRRWAKKWNRRLGLELGYGSTSDD